jgi:hypothetical protein
MPLLASEVLDEAAGVYLADRNKYRWTNDVLLPYLRSAWGELQSALEDNDLPTLHEKSAPITVGPGTVELTLPADFILPISLKERAPGEVNWLDMSEVNWEPDETPGTKLEVWAFRENKIQLLGATSAREVLLRYVKSLSTISTSNSNIEIANAQGFLAARTAGLAASFSGRATERGDTANGRANVFKKEIIGALTKRMQDRPVRRRRYRWR